jgi:glycerophosphoryl diester phosphodiesterase
LIPVHALVGENDNDPLDFGDFRFDTYNVNALLVTPEQIGSLKKRGKIINLFTVNDPAAFHAFAKLGVDGLFTDFPQWFSDKARSR